MYELNVSNKGGHLFATHERSVTSRPQAVEMLKLFKQKFPEREGYEVSVTYEQQTSTGVTEEIQRRIDVEAIDDLELVGKQVVVVGVLERMSVDTSNLIDISQCIFKFDGYIGGAMINKIVATFDPAIMKIRGMDIDLVNGRNYVVTLRITGTDGQTIHGDVVGTIKNLTETMEQA